MNTVSTHTDLLDWCTRLRDAWQQAPEDADIAQILNTAASDEFYPPRPAWAESVDIDAVTYPEVGVTFTTARKVGNVRVDVSETSFVYVDSYHDSIFMGDVFPEKLTIAVTSGDASDNGIFTVDSAHDLVTAMGQLLAKIDSAHNGSLPAVDANVVAA